VGELLFDVADEVAEFDVVVLADVIAGVDPTLPWT
jgi:hypothetical protein